MMTPGNHKLITIILVVLLFSSYNCHVRSESNSLLDYSVQFSNKDLNARYIEKNPTIIELNGESIEINGHGAEKIGPNVWIRAAGTYVLRGIFCDGQIIVDAGKNDDIQIVLAGVDITSQSSAPIYVLSADKLFLTLAEGTNNYLTDSETYIYDDGGSNEPDAVIFSKEDLTINGSGTLIVNANYKHGIVSKDDLKIISGTLVVNSVEDGLKGTDSIAVRDGTISINARGDGIQSNNTEDPLRGYIYIEDGTVKIVSGKEGVQAETKVIIKGGNVTIDSVGDSIHANESIAVNGGLISICSEDDGIHADSSAVFNGGDIRILDSYEGIESTQITINGGKLHVYSQDDGINVAGGNDQSAVIGRPRHNAFNISKDAQLLITGGYVYINSQGDGIDANGSIKMTNGTVIINGPTDNANGALDYDEYFDVHGGLLIAAGSAGMAKVPSSTSSQQFLAVMTSTIPTETLAHIESEAGQEIITMNSVKPFQTLVVSSPLIKEDVSYFFYVGGTSTSTEIMDGIYYDGRYTPGNKVTTVTAGDTNMRPVFGRGMPPR